MRSIKSPFACGLALACAALTLSLTVRTQAQSVTTFALESSVGMVQATDGNFYGAGSPGIFRMTPAGEITGLYISCVGSDCPEGSDQQVPVLGSDGNLYGVARFGGNSTGSGTVYKLTPRDGKMSVLYTFCPNAGCADGQWPVQIVLGSDGNFYGATEGGERTAAMAGPYSASARPASSNRCTPFARCQIVRMGPAHPPHPFRVRAEIFMGLRHWGEPRDTVSRTA